METTRLCRLAKDGIIRKAGTHPNTTNEEGDIMTEANPLVDAQHAFINAVSHRGVGGEDCPLTETLGRTLFETIHAPEDSPPYPRAIVEGFLVHPQETQSASDDTPVHFTIAGKVEPGDESCPQLNAGQAIETATGAIVPDGQMAIVRMWEAQRDDDGFSITRPFPPGFFIEAQGCDIRQGELVVNAGAVLTAEHIGTFASLGLDTLRVARRPRVTVFSSGNEVIPHTQAAQPGTIRDCNHPMLTAAITAAGACPTFGGIMNDDFESFVIALKQALAGSDMVVISGGTAVGGRDFISDLIREVGELLIDGVPMKSGRPLIMGMAGSKPIVAVAGHPPEALRGFRLFGEPAIGKLLGREAERPQDS